MKKIIGIFILITLLPLKANALTGNITISCKDTIKINEEVICQIEGNVDEEVSSIHAVISVENGLKIETVTKDEIWEGDNDATLDLYTADNKKGIFKIATVKVKGLKVGSYNITIKDIIVGDKKFKEHNLSNVSKKITITGNNSSSSSSSSNPSSSSSTNLKPSSSNSVNPSSSSTNKVDKNETVTENPKTGNTIGVVIIMMGISVVLFVVNRKKITDIFN